MGILSFLGFRGKALTGTPAVLEALNQRQLNPYIPLGGTNLRADRINSVYVQSQSASYAWIYEHTPIVRGVVDYIARNAAQLGAKVYERVDDNERRHVGDHPAAEALRNPNPHTPGLYFLQTFFTDYLVFGNAYALKFPQKNGDLWLYNIPPEVVGLVGRSRFAVDAYRIYRDDGSAFDVPPERMVHWRGTSGSDPRRGESYLETLREELAADAASRQATTELYRAGLTPHGWIERPLEAPEITDEGAKRLGEALANQAKASTRRWPILDEGMVLKQGGTSPEDAELLDTRRWTAEHVASLYGMKNVPPETEEERKQFYADVLPPMTEMCASFFDLHILVAEYGADDHYVEFGREKLLDEVYKTMTSASGRPVLLTNEARAKVDLPPVPGGDELVTPGNVSVGGKPSPMVMPIQNPNNPPQDGSHRSGDADRPAAAGSRASLGGWDDPPAAALVRNGSLPKGPGPSTKQLLVPRRVQKERRRNDAVGEFTAAIGDFLTHMERSLKSKGMDAKAIADERWEKKLASELERVAKGTVQREGEITAARLMSSFDMDLTKNYLATVSGKWAAEIAKALRSNLSEEDATEVFKSARENDTPRAALRFATALTGWATLEAGRQDPAAEERTKTWIVTSGNSEHPEMDGESVPLGESFSNGSEGPPADHPGCQCLVEIDGGGHPPQKAIQGEVKVIPPPQPNIDVHVNFPAIPEGAIQSHITVDPPPPAQVNVTTPDVTVAPAEIHNHIEEGAVSVTVDPPPPAQVNVTTPDVNIAPAEVHTHIEEGAVKSVTNIEAPPTPEINFAKGAIHNETPVHVDAPHQIDKGAFEFNVAPADVNVHPAPAPNVNVEMKGGKTKKTVEFSDGRTAEIDESKSTKRIVKFSDGRTAEIEESDEEEEVK